MTDLALLRSSVLALSADTPVEEVADVLGRVEVAGKALKEVKALCEERVLEHVQAHGPIEIGDVRYYAGKDKKTTCKDTRATAEAVLAAAGGDLDTFCEQLASEPFKYGALKALLGKEWARYFEVKETPDLKTGEVKTKLLAVNTRYAGGPR